MKKIGVALLILVAGCRSADKKTASDGVPLETRLAEFMKANDDMDIPKVLDYVYPKLFDIAPRAQLLQAMEDGFNNEEVKVDLDSVKAQKIYPVFDIGDASYAKVSYSMVMVMHFKTNDGTPPAEPAQIVPDTAVRSHSGNENEPAAAQSNPILQSLAEKYGVENVSFDKTTNTYRIRSISLMVAVKDDKAKEWSFVNLKDEEPLMNKLFSKEVLDKLATYN